MEKKKMIRVETLNNGYCLKFDGMKGDGYMYFTPEKLLEGFMVHVGLGITDELNTDDIHDFLTAVMNWNDTEKCVREIESLNTSLRLMTGYRTALAKRLVIERNRLLALYDRIERKVKQPKQPADAILKEIKLITKDKNKYNRLTLEGLCGEKGEVDEEEDDV